MDLLRLIGINRPNIPWEVKRSVKSMAIGVVLVAFFSIFLAIGQQKKPRIDQQSECDIKAVYNFGDSNSDTGGRSAAFMRTPPPYGATFFGKPTGRYCDGRLIIDFMNDQLGLPSLNAYLDPLGMSFRNGANFATAGSTIQPLNGKMFEAKFSPISLDIQILQFLQLKQRSSELFEEEKSGYIRRNLPREEDFSKALYTFDIGQNDITAGLMFMPVEQVKSSISDIVQKLASAIETLYKQGARNFWIHNTGPIGCLPISVINIPSKPEDLDQIGCLKSHNEVAQEFNSQLKEKVSTLRSQLSEAVLTYVDIYTVKYKLISEAAKHGFVDHLGNCCGIHGKEVVYCGMRMVVANGSEVYGKSCDNPEQYISWDGVHYTHAANNWVFNMISDGSYSDPPISVTQACTHDHT